MSVTLNGTSGLVFSDGTIQGTAGAMAFRNKIINGDMRIAQRGTTATATSSTVSVGYLIDRWNIQSNVSAGAYTTSQVSEAPAGSGFTYSLKNTIGSTAPTVTFFNTVQTIEGQNCIDLAWGTADAKSVTASFWVRASVTGIYSLYLSNNPSVSTIRYPTTYTVNQANTWEYKTITVPGPTTGSWDLTNGPGITLGFLLKNVSGSTFNSWLTSGGSFYDGAGYANFAGTANATWQVTGLQFEKAAAATSFEHRPIGTELAMCQRYYERYSGTFTRAAICYANSSTRASGNITWKVTKRANPTLDISSGSHFRLNDAAANRTTTNLTINPNGSRTDIAGLAFDVSSGLTVGATYDADIGVSQGFFAANSEL
jgi:hypothetical protein